MKNDQYSNAFKTVAILLQMVFVIVVMVVFSLIVNLYGGRVPDFSDIGNRSFFHSSYYSKQIAEELKDLTMYLHLSDMEKRSQQGDEKYKQFKLKFDNGDSNFYYWLSQNDNVYTNMPKEYTRKEAIAYAKELGSYFYYDDAAISFTGTMKHTDRDMDIDILRFFRQGSQDGGLIIAVDVSLSKEDAFSEAANVFETYFPWVEFGLFAAIISCMGFILCMIYLTLATGRNGQDDNIHLHRIDYLPTEIHFVLIFFFLTGLIAFCAKLSGKNWGISSSLVLTGTLVFLSDAFLLTLYLSIVRKIKAEIFTSCSLASYMTRTLKEA